MHQQGAIEGELVNALLTLQIVPAIASQELPLGSRFLSHLEEQQKRQLGDVLVIGDTVVAQHVAEVPKPGNDVLGGGHAASPSVLSMTHCAIDLCRRLPHGLGEVVQDVVELSLKNSVEPLITAHGLELAAVDGLAIHYDLLLQLLADAFEPLALRCS